MIKATNDAGPVLRRHKPTLICPKRKEEYTQDTKRIILTNLVGNGHFNRETRE